LTNSDRAELIRLVRRTMGENHPTGKRVVRYLRDGHILLAENALCESIEGLSALIDLDEEEAEEREAPDETIAEDKADLDKYKMLLSAIVENKEK
jgi:hypothetical protein